MNKLAFLILTLCIVFGGCSSIKNYQVLHVAPTDATIKKAKTEDPFVFDGAVYTWENETVRIDYYFWVEKGACRYRIFNKTAKGVYVDWKESALVKNNVKNEYWNDEELLRARTSNYVMTSKVAAIGTVSSEMIKPEMVTFIPPRCAVYAPVFAKYEHPLTNGHFKLENYSDVDIERGEATVSGKIKVQKYERLRSPIVFRNYLTFSETKDFKTSFVVDNEFYVDEIKQMNSSQFNGRSATINGVYQYAFPYKAPDAFYLSAYPAGSGR